MIDKFGGSYILVCDVCGEDAREIFDEFYDAVAYKRWEGWKSRKDEDGEWLDVCPDCQEGWGER